MENSAWKESSVPPASRLGNELSDSSSSEAEKESHGGVHFVVGDGPEEPALAPGKTAPCKEKSGIIRSYSQDTNIQLNEDRTTSFPPKTSYSENSLDASDRPSCRPATALTTMAATATATTMSVKKPLRELPTIMSVDDETLSTDSNSTADNDELKRRRRKLFPAFRKNKSKVT